MDTAADIPRQLNNLLQIGQVSDVDAVRAICRVKTGDIHTDWIAWLAPRAGKTRDWSAPSPGEQVLLLCPGGDMHAAIALRGLYSSAHAAPEQASNKHVTEYPDGARIEYDHESHCLKATLPAGGTAQLTADGGITLTGDVTIQGNVQVSQTLTAQTDVIGGGISLKGHKHGGIQPGNGNSGAPQ